MRQRARVAARVAGAADSDRHPRALAAVIRKVVVVKEHGQCAADGAVVCRRRGVADSNDHQRAIPWAPR